MRNLESLLKSLKLTSLYSILLYQEHEIVDITGLPLKEVQELRKRAKDVLEGPFDNDDDVWGSIHFTCKNIRFVLDDFGFDIRGTLDEPNLDKYNQILQKGSRVYEQFSSFYREELFVDIPVFPHEMSSIVLAQHGYHIAMDWKKCISLSHPSTVELNLRNYMIDLEREQHGYVYLRSRIYHGMTNKYKVHICVRANAVLQALKDLDNYQHCATIFPNMKLPVARALAYVDIASSYAYANTDGGGTASIILYTSRSSAFTEHMYDFLEYWKNTQSEAQYRTVTPIRFNTRISKSLYFMYGGDTSSRQELIYSPRENNEYIHSTEIQLVKDHICNKSFSDEERFQQQACLRKNYGMSRTDLCESEIPNLWKYHQAELSQIDPRFTQIMSKCISTDDWPAKRRQLLLHFQCNMIKLATRKPSVVQTMYKLLKRINRNPVNKQLLRNESDLSNMYADTEAIEFMKFIGWWESPLDNPYRFIFYGLKRHVDDGIELLEKAQRPGMYSRYCEKKFANETNLTDSYGLKRKIRS